MDKGKKNLKIGIITAVILLVILAVILVGLRYRKELTSAAPAEPAISVAPTVTVETPAPRDAGDREVFALELQLTSLGEGFYPAASFCISFDPESLEFMGISEGNLLIRSSENDSGTALPNWSVNTERSNETGSINIMYVDMTGGNKAFSRELLKEGDNVILTLEFRLRDGVKAGDILELSLDDAVFAASDERESLSSAAETLGTVNGRIIIGDSE